MFYSQRIVFVRQSRRSHVPKMIEKNNSDRDNLLLIRVTIKNNVYDKDNNFKINKFKIGRFCKILLGATIFFSLLPLHIIRTMYNADNIISKYYFLFFYSKRKYPINFEGIIQLK